MAVHVPLSIEAQIEARVLMMSVNNILSPANGKPIVVPTQDMVLGIYLLMKEWKGDKGEGKVFADPEDVRIAYDAGIIDEHARIKVRMNGSCVETTTGRIILYEILPPGIAFSMINKDMTKKEIGKLIEFIYKKSGRRDTVVFLDSLEQIGFRYATKSGVSSGRVDEEEDLGIHVVFDKSAIRTVDVKLDDGKVETLDQTPPPPPPSGVRWSSVFPAGKAKGSNQLRMSFNSNDMADVIIVLVPAEQD